MLLFIIIFLKFCKYSLLFLFILFKMWKIYCLLLLFLFIDGRIFFMNYFILLKFWNEYKFLIKIRLIILVFLMVFFVKG